jgi:type I restriction-modification system DNA methylase subunit
MNFNELIDFYNNYIKNAETKVKEFGEVMTPLWLVEDMLNTLPSDVWTNPNLKWLDPCSGIGTFSIIIVKRLMDGLETFEKDPVKRYRHIIENMIYVCEIQEKNVLIYKSLFTDTDTKLNLFLGSFLDKEFDDYMINVWGVNKFDIVVGNPPYNKSRPK